MDRVLFNQIHWKLTSNYNYVQSNKFKYIRDIKKYGET